MVVAAAAAKRVFKGGATVSWRSGLAMSLSHDEWMEPLWPINGINRYQLIGGGHLASV